MTASGSTSNISSSILHLNIYNLKLPFLILIGDRETLADFADVPNLNPRATRCRHLVGDDLNRLGSLFTSPRHSTTVGPTGECIESLIATVADCRSKESITWIDGLRVITRNKGSEDHAREQENDGDYLSDWLHSPAFYHT